MRVSPFLIPLLLYPFLSIYGMGDAPSTCDNRYDGMITSETVTYNNQTFYPMRDNVTITIPNNQNYTVNLIIHTNNSSSNGNTGNTWYSTDVYGFDLGSCVGNVGPNQDVTQTLYVTEPANLDPVSSQQVSTFTFMNSQVAFQINWVAPN